MCLKLAVAFLGWEMKNGRLLKSVCCAISATLASYADVIDLHTFFSIKMK
jgi:hypothetical protein